MSSTSNLETLDPLWDLAKAAFKALNHSNPRATQSCWLCYTLYPPFYEAIGLEVSCNLSTSSGPPQCHWRKHRVGLTMKEVWGRELCLGKVPLEKTPLCAQTVNLTELDQIKWIVPEAGGWWECSHTRLSPCLYALVFNPNREFCVLVTVMPKILYHPEEAMYDYWAKETIDQLGKNRVKREPITTIMLANMFGLRIARAGTRITSLTMQNQGFTSLRAAIDKDITRTEQSISHLEESLTSLSEMVLQNRRGLDLISLHQGGLCATLGEECCFYADHTGVERKSMAKVRKRLAQQKREQEAQQGWFESWFHQSPWLTTLISTLLGPLIILLLILTFGPCILNKLITFVKEQISTVQVMALRQQYQVAS